MNAEMLKQCSADEVYGLAEAFRIEVVDEKGKYIYTFDELCAVVARKMNED